MLSEKFSKKEESLRDLQRDYRYKLEEVEKLARVEKEKHDTVEVKCCVVFFGVLQIVLWVVVRIVNKNFITGCSLDCDFFNHFLFSVVQLKFSFNSLSR